MAFAGSAEPLVVAGTRCNDAESPSGGTVYVSTSWRWEGDGRSGPPEPLSDVSFTAQSSTSWSYELPRRPLSPVPPWATTVVYRAEGRCSYGIASRDYPAAERRVELQRPITPTPSTPTAGPTGTGPPPAVAVAARPRFTG